MSFSPTSIRVPRRDEYLDEHLDESTGCSRIPDRYKHRVNGSIANRLHDLCNQDTRKGENRLTVDVYEYLYEQGLEFSTEPRSVSGEVDRISTQVGENRLVATRKFVIHRKENRSPISQ